MLTVTSRGDDIVKTMQEEERRAQYWLRKQMGGDRKYEVKQDELRREAKEKRETQTSDVIEWKSQAGNRWLCCEIAKYYKEAGEAYAMPLCFCYYETYGSVGAFLPSHNQYTNKQLVIHFTNHFFLRFCQRLGIEMRSRMMVMRFFTIIPGIALNFYDERTAAGLQKVDVRFPASVGRGIVRNEGPVVEVRTYLTDAQLTPKQRRETKEIREWGDNQTFEPMDIKTMRILKSNLFVDNMMKELDAIRKMGADPKAVDLSMSLGVMFIHALCDLGYAKPEDYTFWQRYGESTAKPLVRFAQDYVQHDGCTENDLLELVKEVARVSGLNKIDREAVMQKVVEHCKESNNKHQKQ